MVGRTDSLQTAPNLHDRMWELDGFGDYMKHSFHFQFIVLRRGITFTQMARNLEMHSFCEIQNVHRRGEITSKTEHFLSPKKKTWILGLWFYFNALQLFAAQTVPISDVSLVTVSQWGVMETLLAQSWCLSVRSFERPVWGIYYYMDDWVNLRVYGLLHSDNTPGIFKIQNKSLSLC